MSGYIDGYAFPIASEHLAEYHRLASAIAEIWKEHGALAYREWVDDALSMEGTRSFPGAVEATESDVTVFGWIEFSSREARDSAHEKVAGDPRVSALMEENDSGFDPTRMVFGGFRLFV